MSRTFRRKEVRWSSPREIQTKRAKQALQREIDEDQDCPWCIGGPGCHIGNHSRGEKDVVLHKEGKTGY